MTLVLCLECGAEVSNRARQCPKCGCPLAAGSRAPVPAGEPLPTSPGTFISRRFALGWTGSTIGLAMFILVVGRLGPGSEFAAFAGLFTLLGSSLPIWWKAMQGPRGSAPGGLELEQRLEERLQVAEEQLRRGLVEMEDDSRQIAELQERLDFAERLLAKARDDGGKKP